MESDASQGPPTPGSTSNAPPSVLQPLSISQVNRQDNVQPGTTASAENQPQNAAPIEEPPVNVRDLENDLETCVQTVLSDQISDEEKKLAVEKLRGSIEDFYLLEFVGAPAKATVQMFMHVFNSTAAVPFESPLFALRKNILELVIRFVPADGYKCHTRFLEDLMCRQLVTEYEGNAVLIIKYLNDVVRHLKSMNLNSLLVLINDMRINIDAINEFAKTDTEHRMFIKKTFNAPQLQDYEYMQTVLTNLYFENLVKMLKAPPLMLLPPAKNSIKLVLEFTNLVTSMMHTLKERMSPFMGEIINSFAGFISLEVNMANDKVQPENAAIFHEAQLRMLAFLAVQLKKSEYIGAPNYCGIVLQYKRQIVQSIRMLLRNLSPLSMNHRKDLLMLTKQLFNTDIRRELLDVVPDLCYEEHIVGPPCIMPAQLRSELFCINFDTIHNVRTMLDWTTFQHVFVTVLRSAMDYTLIPSVQAVNWKIVLNILDACRKAEEAVYPQLTVGFNYDSARLMYENAFFAICQKFHTIISENGKIVVHNISNQNLKSEDGKHKPPVEMYTEGQSSDDDSDDDSLGPEYERKPHVLNELRPSVELNSDQEETVDEIFTSTEGDFDDEGKLIVDGESLLENLRLPTKVYPMRMSKRFRRNKEGKKKYAINFQHGPGLESVPASDESDDDGGQKEGYYEMQKSYHRKNSEAFEAHIKLREKIEAPVSDSASELNFEARVHEFAMNCFDRGDLRMRLRRFEKEAQGRKPAKILPLTNAESNFQHVIFGFEDVFPRQGKFDSESGSVQMQPEKFPYSVSDLKLILRNLATSLKVLMNSSHATDDLKSGEPSPPVVAALSDLTRDFILSLDLFTIVPIGGSYGFSYQTIIGPEEKEYVENFISIFHSIHPNVFERVFKQHLPMFFENSLRNGFIANMFISVITAPPLQASTAFVLVDFVMDNLHYATELDEDDTYRYFVYQRVLKATIQCMSALAAQPQPYGFQRKIQEFFFKFAVVCIRRSHNLIDPAAPITSLRTIFRQCGTVVGEALYELFLPLFPSFLQWMSASQNLVANDQIQDSFIEMCLSLPTRLSSLVAYMPMIADAAVNSFIVSANQMQNSIPVNPQGWRTLDLCLDNYYTGVVIDFLQPAGLARILECLYKYVAYVDASQMNIVLKMISKLSGLNHGSVVDVQKLTGKCDLALPSPLLKVHFERSGKQVDSIVTKCYKWNEMAGPPVPGELYFINKNREQFFNIEPVIPSKDPLTVTIPLQTVVTQCLSILRTADIAEGHVQKTFSITGRSEAANFLLNLAKQIFQPELDNSDPEGLLMKLAVVNDQIIAKAQEVEPTWTHPTQYLRPWRCDDTTLRQFNIQVLTGLVYASVNPDFQSLLEKFWEDMVDMLTTLAHLETGLGQAVCQKYHPISLTQTMDAFIVVDVVSAIIQDAVSPRFLACALNTVMRMMQTALSFAPNKDVALNVPLFHHLLAEVCQLCTRTELHTRNSAILVLQHMIEEMPLAFLHAGFGRMFEAVLDVLHFGDDDYSQGCVKAAMSAGETLLDRVLSANEPEEVESVIDSDDDNDEVADEEVEEDAEMYVKEESQDAESDEPMAVEIEEKLTLEVEDVKKFEPVNRIPEFILLGLKQEVSKRYTTSSFPLAEYLCKVVAAMSAVNTDVVEAMFTRDEVTEMLSVLIEVFFTTNFQHRFIGMKLIKSLILALPEHEYVDSVELKRLSEYVKILSFMAQNRDEEVVTGANYATYHLQISPGGHLPPTSNTIKYDNGISFIERVKAFREELASFMAVLTIHLAKSIAYTEVKLLPMPVHLPVCMTVPHMVNLMFTLQVQCAMYTIEERQVFSIKAVEQIALALDFPAKADLIQEITDNIASCKKIYQIHFLAGLVNSPDDFSPKQLNQILNNPENLFTMLANIADFSSVEVKFFESFINICYRAKVTVDDTFLNHIFTLLSRTRIVNALTLGIADFFSPVARFLGAQDADKEISFDWFTAIDRIQQESYRTVFRILAAHPDAKDLLGLWYKYDSKITDLLLHHFIKTGDTSIRIPERCYTDVDHMMIHLLMQLCEAFPHFFAEVSNFPKVIVRFMLSRHFRGNYTLIDHGTDDRDSLKLTLFSTTKATIPEFCTNMIIHTLTVNPYEFNHLLCVCSTLPQVYFNDTSKLRNFIDNFLVPRMTLRWRRALLHFVNEKLNDLFTETMPTDVEGKNFCEFMQVALGNLMNYVLYPAFSYAFDRFMAGMVLDGSNDDVLEREDDWQECLEQRTVNAIDMAKEFCLKSLSLYNEKNYLIRSELAHGILQFSVLLMQRASAHIHEPGMTVQSNDLQNVMQAAWPATSGSGVFTDKWLRAIGLFLLACVMSAVTIKKDIIMQLYDTVVSMPDGRENPILQKTMFVLSRHAVRRKDDCFTFFIDRIRMKLLEDGFNMIKIANTLSMLANNYEDFFPARYLLTPTILFTINRLQSLKQHVSFPFLHDAVKAIVFWEEMRLAKANLFKTTSNDEKLGRLMNDPAMKLLDPMLIDQVGNLIIKLSIGADAERMRKMTPIFHKALHPRVFGRNLFLKLDKMLTPREYELNSNQYNLMINQIMSTTKSLLHYVGTAPISNVYCFTVALQHIPRSVINTNHGPLMDTMVTFVTKLLELCREAEPLDRPSVRDFVSPDKRFVPLYNALSDYVYKVSIRFAARPIADFNDVNVLLTMLKSVTAQSDYAYKTLVKSDVIDIGARMANFFMPSFNNDTDRYKHDLIITLLEVFTVKAELLSPEYTQLYLHNVVNKILTRHENLPAKYHEPICKFLDVSVTTILGKDGKLEDISRQHMGVIGAIARHHTPTLIKYPTLLGHFLNGVARIFGKCPATQFPTDHTELWLAFYTGLSCGEVEIREKFLNIFEESLPKTFFERLVYLFTDETWAFMPGNTFIAVIVNMLFRCVLNNSGPRPVAAAPDNTSDPQRVVPDIAPNAVFVEPEYSYRAPVYGVCIQKSEVVDADEMYPKPAPGGTFSKEDAKYESMHFEQICANYLHHVANAQDHFANGYKDVVDSFLKMIHEGDTCLAIFEDLIPSIWKALTEHERKLLTEVTSQFMVMPIFNTCPSHVAHSVWNAVMRCDPPMPIDLTKLTSSLTGSKFANHALIRFEEQIPRTIDLHTHFMEMRRLYTVLKEDDQIAVTWKNFSLCESAYRAFALYSAGNHKEAMKAIKSAQDEYKLAIGRGEQEITDEKVALNADHEMLSDLGTSVLKDNSRWIEVNAVARKTHDVCMGAESHFQIWQTTDDWNEIIRLSKIAKDSDCPKEMFVSIVMTILGSLLRSTHEIDQVFFSENYEERLRNVIVERIRRLAYYYGPDYVDVFSDLSVFTDIFELIGVMKELYTVDPSKFNSRIDSPLKSVLSAWRLRSCSPSDSPEVASRYYQYRITFLWIMNNIIQKIRPDFRNIYNQQFHLTPAYNIAETAMFKFKALCALGDYKSAREGLQWLKFVGFQNSIDICSYTCKNMRALIKQFHRQPETLKVGEISNEISTFQKADFRNYGPDSVAQHLATMSYVNDMLGDKKRARTNLQRALAIEMATKNATTVHSERFLKTLAVSQYEIFADSPTKTSANDAFEALLRSLNKNFVKNHRHVARGIWAVQNPITLSPNWMAALIPQIPTVVFLPFLENLIFEVVANQRPGMAFFACFIGQVYPLHVLHQLYRLMNPFEFAAVINAVRAKTSYSTESTRFEKEGTPEGPFENNVFQTKPDVLSEREGAKGQLVTVFRGMLPKLVGRKAADRALLSVLYAYQPADVQAYADVLHALDNMKEMPLERVLKKVYKTYDLIVPMVREEIYTGTSKSQECLFKLVKAYDEILPDLKDAPIKLFDFENMTVPGPPELKSLTLFNIFVTFISELEEYITSQMSTISLAEVAPTLYNFTMARAKIPDLAFQHDPGYGQCFAVIENFAPQMRFVAKNLTTWKELDIRLSNGRVVTYRITSNKAMTSTNGNALMSLLNPALEKTCDTMKRSAVFRVPHAVPLRNVTLIEVQNKPVNKLTSKPAHVMTLAEIYCAPQPKRNLPALHPAEVLAEYFTCIQEKVDAVPEDVNAMEVDGTPLDRQSAIALGIRDFNAKQNNDRVRLWFLDYYNDLSTFAYVRKQIATQLGTFSALHWATQGSPITMDDILIDLDYGKVWFLNYHFTGENWKPNVRRKLVLSKQLESFLGDALHGHFEMATVVVAKTLLRRGYEDYVRPLMADLRIVRRKATTTSLFYAVNVAVEKQKEKLKALANFNALPSDTVKLLINQTLDPLAFELQPNESYLFM
uniref:Ufd2P_core domain-containing protein n=1 Tax=Panagrellus redivivus TaxID=6233 RepID=A0A7E4VJ21_PANRE